MPRSALTGTRIRERRAFLGLRQAELARRVGISPSYLNLIEHNRRRIGGKLLVEIARELEVEASQLTQGAGAALIETLRLAAADHQAAAEELDRVEEFAGRFPGWAQLLADGQRRISDMERTVEMLTDRMTHDPFLSASLHEVLSTVTAIRSTAAILAETDDIDPDWQRRFHRNIGDDSQRLAEGAQALVAYLDDSSDDAQIRSSPQEEVEAWLRAQDYHVAALERGLPPSLDSIIAAAPDLTSAPARDIARAYLTRYRQDAEHMPLAAFAEEVRAVGAEPGHLARRFGVDAAAVFRRLAALPSDMAPGPVGLAVCDGSGTLTFRKPVEGFALPRFGAACPLWPLYQALSRPMAPLRAVVETAGRVSQRFVTYALCQPSGAAGFDGPPVLEAAMLILPDDPDAAPGVPVQPVGTSCRICPRRDCIARREPSILSDGF
ncbi:helix-turn-helix domain-containing protein [Rhodovulum iodosum]|uniref:XRE family transcriptional regulator n=1 Tax=Rhodovulum iodosum TaxID=68291 RepID=UPI000F6868F4|nr:XRE family transcriptional regulator [Rhodovulum robiginosum]RSK34872.1 helix-turn-helix domain-containing protein [Rhodovulum robiginosum]